MGFVPELDLEKQFGREGLACAIVSAEGGADLYRRAEAGRRKRNWADGWVWAWLVEEAGQTGSPAGPRPDSGGPQ